MYLLLHLGVRCEGSLLPRKAVGWLLETGGAEVGKEKGPCGVAMGETWLFVCEVTQADVGRGACRTPA